jgi:hypothetical protein
MSGVHRETAGPSLAKDSHMAKRSKDTPPATGNPTEGEEFTEEDSSVVEAAHNEAGQDVEPVPLIAEGEGAELSKDLVIAIVEAAVTRQVEVLAGLGKNGLEAAEPTASSLADDFRKLANETAGYSKESLDTSYAFAGELRQAESLLAAFQIQIEFAKSAYIRLIDHFIRMSGIYWSLARGASKPAGKAAVKAGS